MGELGQVHRHELSGALHGLMRVRTFTQDDAHIFMLPEQIRDEVIGVVKFIDDVYNMFGFTYHIELSTMTGGLVWEPTRSWETATRRHSERLLEELRQCRYVINEGDGKLSTVLSSTSTWRTRWAGHGSAVLSSWICRCRSVSSLSIQVLTVKSIAPL